MYVGRFLVVAPGRGVYRVSSRSFPDREAGIDAAEPRATIRPTPDAEPTDNPYVEYNCLRTVDGTREGPMAALGNGSHVDPVAEKLALGYPARDALAQALLTLDFERDAYDTPRIAAVVSSARAVVGVVRRDALHVETVDAPTLVATYEHDAPVALPATDAGATDAASFDTLDAAGLAAWGYDRSFEHPVCAVGVRVTDDDVTAAVHDDRAR